MPEILKQLQFKPLTVEKQVIAIFAGINGYLDDLEVSKIRVFEEALYAYLDGAGRAVARKLLEKKSIDDAMKLVIEFVTAALSGFMRSVNGELRSYRTAPRRAQKRLRADTSV